MPPPSPTAVASLEPAWSIQLDEYVTCLQWSPSGALVAAGTAGGPVYLIDGKNGQILHQLPGHMMGTLCLSFAPAASGGQWLASGGQDGKARIYDLSKPTAPPRVVAGGASWVEHVAWSSLSSLLATGAGKKLKFWKPDGTLSFEPDLHPSAITGMQWHPSGHMIATIAYGGVFFWDPKLPICQRIAERKELLIAMRYSPTGKWIACGQNDPCLFICNTASENHLQMQGYQAKVGELAWDATGLLLATGGGSKCIVWDFGGAGPARTKPKMLVKHAGKVTDLAFDPRGKTLATAGDDGLLFLWRVKAEQVFAVAPASKPISKIAYRADGTMLAAGDESGVVRGFDTRAMS